MTANDTFWWKMETSERIEKRKKSPFRLQYFRFLVFFWFLSSWNSFSLGDHVHPEWLCFFLSSFSSSSSVSSDFHTSKHIDRYQFEKIPGRLQVVVVVFVACFVFLIIIITSDFSRMSRWNNWCTKLSILAIKSFHLPLPSIIRKHE